jgi:AraC-like DNA-binding protein
VEYAMQLLLREPRRSIIDIAFRSGYNNKNSFYNAFKRHTGTTPSEYRRTGGSPRAPAGSESA